ncbi:biotin--[acetyl-CoA-carboxylase] ligase [Falsirhodobacter xinxiangensis]|uniref:biotin--[acetyl-CoA-carboxylase] ligase n=1 Tax=Falsirhodobacter xinxiangensis TaxID=2530049 RepID=UPI0010AA476B|nr:biotin--[acetyl-CoA-carboxylase] ligase [Rhodobacter xinxiangensis]
MSADWPKGVRRHLLETVDSTNAYGLRLDALPAWVVAGEQTAGRGRRGRAWASPRGNFYGSLILALNEPPEQVALRSFVAALALRDACIALTDLPEAFRLKWPNDVLLNGGKLSGILLEAQPGGRLAIGIGINLISAPPPAEVEAGAVPPVSLLAETGVRVSPEAFLDRLAPAYAAREAQFQSGFASIREDFLSVAARLGETIIARTGQIERRGVYRTIDDSGALVLDCAEGRVAIPAADVFFHGG